MINDEYNINNLRKRIMYTAYHGNTGHIASAFSVIEVLYVLYCKKKLKFDPLNPNWDGRDRLVMSKGQGSLALYAVLSEVGFFPEEELKYFCHPGHILGGEPKLGEIPGVEASTGSLGHGLSYGIGMAMAYKKQKKDNQVFVILGDGECQEGSIWEGVMSAVNFRLDNLTVIMDNNKLQAMGPVRELMSIEEWDTKWKSFGWEVLSIDGHNVSEIEEALSYKTKEGVPKLIISNTIKGKGVSFMENVPIWHFRMPNESELKIVLEELDMTMEELQK